MNIQNALLSPGVKHGRPMTKLRTLGNKPVGVVIHYVGNPGSSAAGNRNWFQNGSGGAGTGAHYIVGLNGEILHCVPDDEVAYHAGRSFGPAWNEMVKTNNFRFVGIECCHPDASGRFNDKTYAAVVWLTAFLCKKYGLNISQVYRHYDVCGKSCPMYYANNQAAWQKLKADINAKIGSFGQSSGQLSSQAAVQTAVQADVPILAAPTVTIEQMKAWARSKNAPDYFVGLADRYYHLCQRVGIDPAVAYVQFALETGFGKFPSGIIDASYCNPCGLKTTAGGGDYEAHAHQRFASWDEGTLAQVDHLALYAGVDGYPKADTPDPRHFPFIRGKVKTLNGLAGTWATDPQYGVKLTKLIGELRATQGIPPAAQRVTGADASASDWARDAWAWAKAAGITDGARPQDTATREQVIMMLWAAFYRPRPSPGPSPGVR